MKERTGGGADKGGANLQVRGNESLPGPPVQRGGEAGQVRVVLPAHLQTLARAGAEVTVAVRGIVTRQSVLDALEARYPTLRGTTRDHATGRRRPFIRFFACEEDLSNQPPDAPLPEEVAAGDEPLLIIGAIAGG